MKYVQLLEIADTRSGEWLTLWDLDKERQLSVELTRRFDLEPGMLFRLDEAADPDGNLLEQIGSHELPAGVAPPVAVSEAGLASGARRIAATVFAASKPGDEGMIPAEG